jgi:hypothetical protein
MTVSICTTGHLREADVAAAENTAQSLFHPAGIDVKWASCEAGLEGDEAAQQHWFTLRLRDGESFIPLSSGAGRTLGEAFLLEDGGAYIGEVYYQPVQMLAEAHNADSTVLLGYVIAHELCHLLLGGKHSQQGVMRAAWDSSDLASMTRAALKFSPSEGARMRQVLQESGGH